MVMKRRIEFLLGAGGQLMERAAMLCQVAQASAGASEGSSDPEQAEDGRRWAAFSAEMACVCVYLRNEALAGFQEADSGIAIARPAVNGKITVERG